MILGFGAIPAGVADVLAPLADGVVDSEVRLLAVTGSLANGTWRSGWSDIDALLVRASLPPEWLRMVAAVHTPEVHISAFTDAEVATGILPPRVLNAVRLIAADGRGVLHRDPAWTPPFFDLQTGAGASASDLPQALLLLRRQLMIPQFDLRAVYKLIILIARIRLRLCSAEPDISDEVITAYADLAGLPHDWLPKLDEVVEAYRQRHAATSQLAYRDAHQHLTAGASTVLRLDEFGGCSSHIAAVARW